jgi:hypothetical protein
MKTVALCAVILALLLPLNARENTNIKSEGIYKIPAMEEFQFAGINQIAASPDRSKLLVTNDYIVNLRQRLLETGSPEPAFPEQNGLLILNPDGTTNRVMLPPDNLNREVMELIEKQNHPLLKNHTLPEDNQLQQIFKGGNRVYAAEFIDNDNLLITLSAKMYFEKKDSDNEKNISYRFSVLMNYNLQNGDYNLNILMNNFDESGKPLSYIQNSPFLADLENGKIYSQSQKSNYAKETLGLEDEFIFSCNAISGEFISETAPMPRDLAEIDLSMRFFDFSYALDADNNPVFMDHKLNKVFDKDGNEIFKIGDAVFENEDYFGNHRENSKFNLTGITGDGQIVIHYDRTSESGHLQKLLVFSPKGRLLGEIQLESNLDKGEISKIHTSKEGKIYIFRKGFDWTMEVLSL